MPDRSKVRWSQLKVGLVGMAGFLILGVLIFLLTSTKGIFQDYVILRTYMDDASGVTEGTEVRLNGISHVGYVERLQLTGSQDKTRTVEFVLKVHAHYLKDIPVDSVAGIAAANLLGDKYININRGTSSLTVQEGAVLVSLQSQDIPEMLASFSKLMASFQTSINRVDSLLKDVEAGKGNIGLLLKDDQFYNRLNGIASEGQKLLADIRNGKGTFSKLIYDPALYDQVVASLKRVDTVIADLESGHGTAGMLLKDPGLYDDARKTIAEITSLVAEVNNGKGDVTQFLKSDQLHKRVDELMSKLVLTIDKINAGEGTIGQLMVNPQLYQALAGTATEFQSLAKDMHANPKKFLTITLKDILSARKQLVVNADDFGFTPDVNEGIVEAHRNGILTATTIMANGEAFDDAIRLAAETPTLDIGCHLVLVSGTSLVTGRPYPLTVAQLIGAMAKREIRVYEELAAQVKKIVAAGIEPTHLDTHKHTHLAPPVLDAVARIAQEFGIQWVRRPFDMPLNGLKGTVPRLKRVTSGGLGFLRKRFHRVLENHGCRTTDHFAGFQITGRFGTPLLVELLGILPEGSTELMVHPGRCREWLLKARTRLKESREDELEALVSGDTRSALERHGIELVNYRALA